MATVNPLVLRSWLVVVYSIKVAVGRSGWCGPAGRRLLGGRHLHGRRCHVYELRRAVAALTFLVDEDLILYRAVAFSQPAGIVRANFLAIDAFAKRAVALPVHVSLFVRSALVSALLLARFVFDALSRNRVFFLSVLANARVARVDPRRSASCWQMIKVHLFVASDGESAFFRTNFSGCSC